MSVNDTFAVVVSNLPAEMNKFDVCSMFDKIAGNLVRNVIINYEMNMALVYLNQPWKQYYNNYLSNFDIWIPNSYSIKHYFGDIISNTYSMNNNSVSVGNNTGSISIINDIKNIDIKLYEYMKDNKWKIVKLDMCDKISRKIARNKRYNIKERYIKINDKMDLDLESWNIITKSKIFRIREVSRYKGVICGTNEIKFDHQIIPYIEANKYFINENILFKVKRNNNKNINSKYIGYDIISDENNSDKKSESSSIISIIDAPNKSPKHGDKIYQGILIHLNKLTGKGVIMYRSNTSNRELIFHRNWFKFKINHKLPPLNSLCQFKIGLNPEIYDGKLWRYACYDISVVCHYNCDCNRTNKGQIIAEPNESNDYIGTIFDFSQKMCTIKNDKNIYKKGMYLIYNEPGIQKYISDLYVRNVKIVDHIKITITGAHYDRNKYCIVGNKFDTNGIPYYFHYWHSKELNMKWTTDVYEIIKWSERWINACINSQLNGIIYFGVNNDGIIVGQKHFNKIKQQYIVEQINKRVQSWSLINGESKYIHDISYTIDFIKVMDIDGYEMVNSIVIRLKINGNHKVRYGLNDKECKYYVVSVKQNKTLFIMQGSYSKKILPPKSKNISNNKTINKHNNDDTNESHAFSLENNEFPFKLGDNIYHVYPSKSKFDRYNNINHN